LCTRKTEKELVKSGQPLSEEHELKEMVRDDRSVASSDVRQETSKETVMGNG
jgi:hypothetical protein